MMCGLFNKCTPPVPPLGWLPSTGEPLTYPQPHFVPLTETGSSYGSSDRAFLESMNANMLAMFGEIRTEMQGMRLRMDRLTMQVEDIRLIMQGMRPGHHCCQLIVKKMKMKRMTIGEDDKGETHE
ncbi:hypothetical protein LIER_37700 [Lithospermum erythrorhizon]|uniref:Uncharacterized protein n=1 Tax=Lithospermum erythrorhizon TaxID=34254 RepID=A0AAV3PR48_LITER